MDPLSRIAELEELLEQAEEAILILWTANKQMAQERAELIPEPQSKTVN